MSKRKADELEDGDPDSPVLLSPDALSDLEELVNPVIVQTNKAPSDDEDADIGELEAPAEVEVAPDEAAQDEGPQDEGQQEEVQQDEAPPDEDEEVDVEKQQAQDHEKMQELLGKFTPAQTDRYEYYRRSGFQKSQMKRLLQTVAGCTISTPMIIAMSGLAKMFVGDIVETARMIMTERNDSGPIRPCYIRQAYRRLKLEGRIPQKTRPRLFRG